ncbi:MAG: DUF3990 domain-containing protein [Hungatella hathewayi]|nr:DUF3990 domain-containing protein [Hungatella hathewayi]
MEGNLLYHGSNVIVNRPKVVINGHYKDFGYGFYCTNMEKQAKRWALTKRGASVVNCYIYTENKKLSICSFSKMTDAWLDFVVACRRGVEHTYDIVEGPMADDQIWDYVEDFVSGVISRAAFWELVKFKYPTHQISFCTEDALAALQYERSYAL